MPEGVIDFLEVVEIDPMQGKAASGSNCAEPVLELLAEVVPVGDLGQRIMTRQPIDFLLGKALFGDVLLNIDPAAAGERLVADQDDAAALEVLRVRERLSARELRHVVLNPLALFLEIVWIVAACFHLDVETHDLLPASCRAE